MDGIYSRDVARICGVSLRQIQWWDERGVVSPKHVDGRRVYSQAEVLEILVIVDLGLKGFSLQRIRTVVKALQIARGQRLLQSALLSQRPVYLLTDGDAIRIAESAERVVEILKGACNGMVLVCITDHARRLMASVAA